MEHEAIDEFEVERILAVRLRGRTKEYLIKWKGFNDFENTWEPEANLSNATELL